MRKYTGTCYLGMVGSETGPLAGFFSAVKMQKRDGDGPLDLITGTKGYQTRQTLINRFMASDHDFLLMLDHDMEFAPDTLERLRSHELPFVSGYYLRRQEKPILPVWFAKYDGKMPYMPFLAVPEKDMLYEIGASGWGCILIHRDVITETRKILKDEPDVIEDDMDVWPYDLREVLAGREQLRPLKVLKDPMVGSDVRFAFYALQAGFQLVGDSAVRPEHFIQFGMDAELYGNQSGHVLTRLAEGMLRDFEKVREEYAEAYRKAVTG